MIQDLPRKLAENTPYYKYLGIDVIEASDGRAKLRLDFKDYLTHPFGYFHGGVIASLADSAGINSVLSTLKGEEKAVTLEMKINYLLPVKDSVVFAEAMVIHRGRKSAVADVDVKSEDGKLVAKAIVTCVIM